MAPALLTPDGRQSAKDTAESIKINVNGAPLGEEYLSHLLDVHVRDNLLVPDWASVRIRDPSGTLRSPFLIGDTIEILFGADKDQTPTKVFTGDIVALEPEWRQHEAIIAARAFDKGHRLNREKTSKTFINAKAEDIVGQLVSAAGITLSDVDHTRVVIDHLQQSQETNWALCWRLARMNGFEFGVSDGKAYFRKRPSSAPVATLTWQDNLQSFQTRASGVGQVSDVTVNSHDPKAGQPTSSSANSVQPAGTATIWQQRAKAVTNLGGGKALVADRVAASTSEAEAMANAALVRNASAFVEAEGMTKGSPKLRAGATVKIAGVGDFSGDYTLSATTHVFRGGGAYTTKLEITGDRTRTFAQLAGGGGGSSPTGGAVAGGGGGDAKSSWAQQLVVGIVDNNNDPEKLGRVKVKFPALGSNMVSDWARVATLNAGKERGLFMLPQAGDQVVVGFEHGDPRRPFVLGSLYTGGTAPAPADLLDGQGQKAKFGVKTDHEVLLHSKKEMKFHTEEKLTVEVKSNPGDLAIKADGNVKAEAAKNFEAKATSSAKVEGTSSLELKSSGQVKVEGSSVSISGSGMVEVKGSMIKLG